MKDEKELRLQEISQETPEPESASDCEFCGLLCHSDPKKGPDEAPSPHFMTERELRVLASMRRLKEEVSRIKEEIRSMEQQGTPEDISNLSATMEDLRAEWKRMDEERMDAAEERMRLLGHIQ
jgi:hypothetical protein